MSKRNQDNVGEPAAEAQPAAAETAPAPVPAPETEGEPAFAWEPHEEIPQAGGSYIRQSDGSLVKAEPEQEKDA